MKCYFIVNKDEDGAVPVKIFSGKAFIKLCECSEDAVKEVVAFSEKNEICMDSHWSCSARTDNGIDSNEVTGSDVIKIAPSQVVLSDGELSGVYLPDYGVVIEKTGSVIVNREEEGYEPGWGDVSTYMEIYLRACK